MVPTFDPAIGPVRLGIGVESRLCVVRFGQRGRSGPGPPTVRLFSDNCRIAAVQRTAGLGHNQTLVGRPAEARATRLISRPLLFFTSGTPCGHRGQSDVLSVSCPKNGDVPKSPLPYNNWH